MRYNNFGSTSFKVSEIGFGCARLGGIFASGGGKREMIRVLHQAQEAGINYYDTADMYTQGESETLLGKAFRRQRDQVIIASKGGYLLPQQRHLVAKIKPLVRPIIKALGLKRQHLPSSVSGTIAQDFSADYISNAIEGSLRRLQTDYIDIYQLHSPPSDVINSGDFLEPLEKAHRQGKIRHFGIAADCVEDAVLCLQHPEVKSIQVPFGLLDQEAVEDLLPNAEAQGVAIIARGCFGGGLLKPSLSMEELQELTPKWGQILALRQQAKEQDRSVLELALEYSLGFSAVSTTLLGMRTSQHLQTNLQYLESSLFQPVS